MNTTQILCTLKDVRSFLGVFPSEMLPRSVMHIWHGHNKRRSSHGEMFTLASRTLSNEIIECLFLRFVQYRAFVPDLATFIRRYCIVWDYNRRQLQALTSNICGKYSSLFAHFMDRGFTAKQFVGQFDGAPSPVLNRQIVRSFASEFGSPKRSNGGGDRGAGGGQCRSSFL